MTPSPEHAKLIDDIAACSAAMLFNTMPDLMRLSDSERFERLRTHVEGALMALRHFAGRDDSTDDPRRLPEPGRN